MKVYSALTTAVYNKSVQHIFFLTSKLSFLYLLQIRTSAALADFVLRIQRVLTFLEVILARVTKASLEMEHIVKVTRNTCTQQPLARFPNLFSVITVILLIDMPIPFKFNSVRFMLPINNAANSLGLGSKKCSEHFTPSASHSTILIVFFLLFLFVNY